MKFTEARVNVGADQLVDAALFEAPAMAPFTAQIDPGTGSITDGNLQVPQFSTFIEDDPVDADVTVDFEIGVITGSFDQATGALTLKGKVAATLTANEKECAVYTNPAFLTLTTTGDSGGATPRSGAPFTAGLTGPGAIAGRWEDMVAIPFSSTGGDVVCEVAEEAIEGPGGIWLEQEGFVVPPPPPPPPPPVCMCVLPPPRVCVVPKLAGKTLKAAKRKIKSANCTLGKVGIPKPRKGLGRLVVKSFNPGVGARPANGKVHLRLGPKPDARA